MRHARWLRFGAVLLVVLLVSQVSFAQTPSPPFSTATDCVADPTNPRCQLRSKADGFWTDFFGRVPTTSQGEWLMLDSPAAGGEEFTARFDELVAIDGGQEVGRVAFNEAPLSRVPVHAETRSAPDGTPITVTLETVAGTVMGENHSQALGGLLVTASKPGMTIRLVRLLATGSDLGQVSVAASRMAARLQPSTGTASNATGPLPPVLEDASICLPFGEEPDEQCGAPFCEGLWNLFKDSVLCLFGVLEAIASCGTAATPYQWALCVWSVIGTVDSCGDVLVDVDRMTALRRTAEECYCANFPEYESVCEMLPEKEITALPGGLLPGETVEVTGSCGNAEGMVQASNTVRLKSFSLGEKVISCATPQYFRVSGGRVSTPGVSPQNSRMCISDSDRWIPVEGANTGATLRCDCTDPLQCPGLELYATVSGLGANPQNLEVRMLASIWTPLPNGSLGHEIGSGGSTRTDGELILGLPAFAGATVRYIRTPPLPGSCRFERFLVPDGGQIPAVPSGTGRVKLAEILCNTTQCTNPAGCGDVEARISLSGNAVTRPGGIRVLARINGQNVQKTLTSSNDLLGTFPAGSPFENLAILNHEMPFGAFATSVCDLTGPTSGTVGTSNPSYISSINCDRMREVSNSRPRPPVIPAGGVRECRTFCSPPTPCPSTGDSYCETMECIDICDGGGGGGGLPFWRPNLYYSVWSPKDDGDPSDPIEVDDEMVIRSSAIDPDGIQAFAVFVDDEFVHHVFGGGHSAAEMPPYTVDTSNLSPGPHMLSVYAYDNNPEASGASIVEMPFTVEREPQGCAADAVPPVVSFFHPTNGAQLSHGNVTIGIDSSDASGVDWVQFYLDGDYRGTDAHVPYQHIWSASPGIHELKAVAKDGCGNYGEAMVEVTVTDPCAGQPQPTVQITGLADGAWLEPDRYTITAQANATPGQSIEQVTFRVGSFTPFVDNSAPWSTGQYLLLTEGRVPIEVEARDTCGRVARHAIEVNISANASACEIDDGPPTASFLAPLAGATLTAGIVNVVGDVEDDLVLLAGALEVDGQVPAGHTVLSSNPAVYQWSWNATPGAHTLRLRIADVCWNVTVSDPITVNVTAPASVMDPEFLLLPAELRTLNGPTIPAGPPLQSLEEVDFGNVAGGRAGAVRSFSLLNDGGRALTVSAMSISGDAFAFDPPPSLPLVVPGFRGEAFLRIKPTGVGVGPVTGTLTLQTDIGTFSVKLKALVDPNAQFAFSSQFHSDFDKGNLSEWTSVTGSGVSASLQAAHTGDYGLEIDFLSGTAARFVTHSPSLDLLTAWRAKFAVRPRDLQLSEGETIVIAAGVRGGTAIGWVQARKVSSAFEARAIALLDNGEWAATSWIALINKYQTLDLLWWKASSPTAADGGIRLVTSNWVMGERTGLQNAEQKTERFRLGAGFGAPAGTTGVLHYDDVTIWH